MFWGPFKVLSHMALYWLAFNPSPTGTVDEPQFPGMRKRCDTELLVENTSSGGKVAMKFCCFPMKTIERSCHYIYIYTLP